MVTSSLIVGAVVLLALLVVLGLMTARVYLKFHGDRVITCPENHRAAGVGLDLGHALFTTLEGQLDLRLKTCSRWPEKQDCGQECVRQIEATPEECRVRTILEKWYAGKSCAVCGKPVGNIHWADHKPALLNAAHQTVQWQDVPAETVPEVLLSHQPVCWNCHVVNSLIAHHPELVVDRSRPI